MAFNLSTDDPNAGISPSKVPLYRGDTVGGDLTGTFPNLFLGPGSVSSDKIATGAVGTDEIADGAITGEKIASDAFASLVTIISGSQILSGLLENAHISDHAAIATTKLAEGLLFINNYDNQVVSGVKVFYRARAYGNPVFWFDLANKGYIDSGIASISSTVADNSITLAKLTHPAVSGSAIYTPGISQGHLLSGYVDLSSNQIISGGKIFQHAQSTGFPTNSYDLVNKGYADALAASVVTTPNYISINNFQLPAVSGNVIWTPGIGQGHLASGYVDLFTNQTISGVKLFHLPTRTGNPINNQDLANKGYVDSVAGSPTVADNSITLAKLTQPAVSGNTIWTPGISQGHILSGYVDLFTNQVISGGKIFQHAQSTGAPTNTYDLTNKLYVDNLISGVSGGGGGGPTGPAGGDLTGTYPNPTLANSVVSGDKIQANAILPGHLGDGMGCRVTNSVNQSIGNAVFTIHHFDTDTWDIGNIHSTTSGVAAGNEYQVIPTMSGVYTLSASVIFAANTTGLRYLHIRRNGTAIAASVVAGLADNTPVSASTVHYLYPNDFLEIHVEQTSGAALNSLTAGERCPWFAIQRIN